VFGRVEVVLLSIFFYVIGTYLERDLSSTLTYLMIGTIVEATSTGVESFAAGAVLYQVCPSLLTLSRRLTI
jgi:SIT family siderophore-iron:H+ symporter-like MFS transporter